MNTLDEILTKLSIPIVAVTGTNGKSSVCKMIETLLTLAGKKVFLAGADFGKIEAIEGQEQNYEIAVLELKSSLLQKLPNIKPKIAVLTSLVPAHAERHASLTEYFEAKKNVFRNQDANDFLVYCSLAQYARDLVKEAKAVQIAYDYSSISKKDWSHFHLLGDHQKLNALAAIEIARLLNIDEEIIRHGIESYSPLPGRLSFCGQVQDRFIYDSSRASNAAALAWDLSAFSKKVNLVWQPVYLDSLEGLLPVLKEKVETLFLCGPRRFDLERHLRGFLSLYYTLKDWRDISKIWLQKTKPGESILLAPGFSNFSDWVEVFQ